MSDLSKKKCDVCTGKTPQLSLGQIERYWKSVPQWQWRSDGVDIIERTFIFDNFQQAVKFFNKVAKLAEKENHHPDMSITKYRKVTLTLTTHAVKGLTENDFIMAAKINKLKGD